MINVDKVHTLLFRFPFLRKQIPKNISCNTELSIRFVLRKRKPWCEPAHIAPIETERASSSLEIASILSSCVDKPSLDTLTVA